MSLAVRGVRNSFRNKTRSGAVVLVLALAVGLTLSMLVVNKAVAARLADVHDRLDRTVTAQPVFDPGGGEAPTLSAEQLDRVRGLPHVGSAHGYVWGELKPPEPEEKPDPTAGGAAPAHMIGGVSGDTNLVSGIDPEQVGAPMGMVFPLQLSGTDAGATQDGTPFTILSGRKLAPEDRRGAIVSDKIAERNGLSVGGTFTAFGETFTVVGIAAAGEFDQVGVVMTAATVFELGEATGYSQIIASADDVDHLGEVADAMSELLGETVRVESKTSAALQATQGLSAVHRITWLGFLICLFAAAAIVFFTLAMTVRERRREVGVLKAIGGTTRGVIAQFGIEAATLVLAGTVLGLGVAAVGGNLVAKILVATNGPAGSGTGTGSAATVVSTSDGAVVGGGGDSAADLVGTLAAGLDWRAVGLGLLCALGIALLGSVLPAWLIARVRPAEVLRGE